MLILGLLLIACTAAFTGLALADNLSGGPHYNVTVLGHQIANMNALAIFCAGLGLALIFGLGCVMTMAGGMMRRRKARKLHGARHDAAATARERDALAARMQRGPGDASGDAPGYGTAAGTGGSNRVDAPPRRHRAHHLFGH